jgi:hypothetical protein
MSSSLITLRSIIESMAAHYYEESYTTGKEGGLRSHEADTVLRMVSIANLQSWPDCGTPVWPEKYLI